MSGDAAGSNQMGAGAPAAIQVVVIGAGVAGLSCSINLLRTAKRLGQRVSVTVLERRDGPGGTWSNAAVYPGLITNNSWRSMLIEDNEGEMAKMFSENPEYGAGPGLFRATGPAMTQHMLQVEQLAKTLGTSFMYQVDVTSVVKRAGGGWTVSYRAQAPASQPKTIECDKLVCAAGSFSAPSVPSFLAGHWSENVPEKVKLPIVVHTAQLSASQVDYVANDAQEVVVVGASKSAMDAAERFALMGRKVTLIVKNAPYMAPPSFHDKAGKPADAAAGVGSRLMTAYIPYFQDPVSGMISSGGMLPSLVRWFLHATWIGGFVQRALERKITSIFAEFNQWDKTSNNAAMKPETPMTWMEGSTYPGPEHLPRLITEGKVSVIRGAAIAIQPTESSEYRLDVQCNDGAIVSVKGDLLIFGTGWRTGEHAFFARELADELGMPRKFVHLQDRPEHEALFEDLDSRNLDKLLASCRTLRDLPAEWKSPTYGARAAGTDPTLQVAPFRLYRLMVPLSHLQARDIVFPGITTNKSNTIVADAQGHWIADYLLESLPTGKLPSYSKAAEEVSMHVVWSRRLFGPAHGQLASWLGTAWFEYIGRLCWDMGLPADDAGLTGVIYSGSFKLEEKRIERDAKPRPV